MTDVSDGTNAARLVPLHRRLERVVAEPGFGLCALGPLAIGVWDGPATREQALLATRLLEELASEHESVLLVSVLGSSVPPASPEVRQLIANGINDVADHMGVTVSVVEGEGFVAAAMRAALLGMSLVMRRRWPQEVTASVEAAARAVSRYGVEPAEVVEAVASLRESCRLPPDDATPRGRPLASLPAPAAEDDRAGSGTRPTLARPWPTALLNSSFRPPPMLCTTVGRLFATRWASIEADVIRESRRQADAFANRTDSMVQLYILGGQDGPVDARARDQLIEEVRRMSIRGARNYFVCESEGYVVRSVQEAIARADVEESVWNVTLAPSVEYVLSREGIAGLGVTASEARGALMAAGVWATLMWVDD